MGAEINGLRIAEVRADVGDTVKKGQVLVELDPLKANIDMQAAEAALARTMQGDPRLAERFELYICGVELVNGFGELTDAGEQRQRFEAEMAEKQRIHGERYPIDEEFLAALSQMPEASGVAMGFDRLVMLATGADSVERVMWTPPEV